MYGLLAPLPRELVALGGGNKTPMKASPASPAAMDTSPMANSGTETEDLAKKMAKIHIMTELPDARPPMILTPCARYGAAFARNGPRAAQTIISTHWDASALRGCMCYPTDPKIVNFWGSSGPQLKYNPIALGAQEFNVGHHTINIQVVGGSPHVHCRLGVVGAAYDVNSNQYQQRQSCWSEYLMLEQNETATITLNLAGGGSAAPRSTMTIAHSGHTTCNERNECPGCRRHGNAFPIEYKVGCPVKLYVSTLGREAATLKTQRTFL